MNVEANANTGSYHAQQKEGFANVARWLSLDRDNETFIYRRFNELSARNILYLQCELLDLEKKLNELDKKDVTSDDMDLKDVARTWETFMQRFEEGNSEAVVRMELITKLRAKIKEYRTPSFSLHPTINMLIEQMKHCCCRVKSQTSSTPTNAHSRRTDTGSINHIPLLGE